MIEYDGIYLKNRVLNMPEFWMCLMQYKLLCSYRDRETYSERYQTFKMKRFVKKTKKKQHLSAEAQPKIFQGKGEGEASGWWN